MIKVERKSKDEYEVIVREGKTETNHLVALDDAYHRHLTQGKISKEELIKRSFEFLLKREPKESILPRFNLKVISRYFPEYEEEMKVK